jgi:hypothetical protein
MEPKQVLSLGAGVQSSTIALMSAVGELPPLDFAVFADTGAEPPNVYKWLDWLEAQLPYPVHRVQHKDGLEAAEGQRRISGKTGRRYVKSAVPMWTQKHSGKMGGSLMRKCTLDYKINPIRQAVKRLAGVKRGQKWSSVTQWIGISTDEAHRMKPSPDKWTTMWWPLIDHDMSRADCLRWMQEKGYPMPPRSSCVFCPYHSPQEWHRLQTEDPESYEAAARFEDYMRAAFSEHDEALDAKDVWLQYRVPGVPLREIDWEQYRIESQKDANRQASLFELDGFGNECEGMCGL